MNRPNKPFQPFFFDFFHRLKKEVGIELDGGQYEAFLTCWLRKPDLDKAGLLYLCETLWLTRAEFRAPFARLFEEQFALAERYFAASENREADGMVENEPSAVEPAKEIEKAPETLRADPNPFDPTGGEAKESGAGLTLSDPIQPIVDQSSWSEISLRVKDSSQGNHGGGGEVTKPADPSNFIFLPEKALPFPVRKTTQMWRKVATHFVEQPTDRLDVSALVRQRIRDGVVHRLEYETEKVEHQPIVWLSDHEGSMNPFQAWEKLLLRAVTNAPSTSGARLHGPTFDRYFFHDSPVINDKSDDFRMFVNRSHTEVIDWTAARKQRKWDKHTLVVIYSDAAAAHRKLDFERVKTFYEVCHIIRLTTPRLLWINPVRQTEETSAQYIAYFVEMIYPDEPSLARFTAGLPALTAAGSEDARLPVPTQPSETEPAWPQPNFSFDSADSLSEIRLEAFREVCSTPAHTWLACHAAFPVALTTDLLQQIWLNFQTDENGTAYPIPLATVDEVLHSPIAREVGRDLYEMYPAIREVLLDGLRNQWGENREWRLATFIKKYLAERRNHVSTATLAAAETINYQTRTMTPSELTEEINGLLDKSQKVENAAERLKALTQIDYLLSVAKHRSRKGTANTMPSPLQALQKLREGMLMAREEGGEAVAMKAFDEALPFLEKSPLEGGYKVKLPSAVQEKLLEQKTTPEPVAPQKPALFALLVGVNDYTRFPKLNGCLNDVEMVGKYLQSRTDFEVNIKMLTDREATRQGIIDAFRTHLSQAGAADTIIFYFAGHGALEKSDDYWVEESKAWECVVCNDTLSKNPSEFLLASGEVEVLMEELFQATNAHIVSIYDCCYPNQNTRSGSLIAASYQQVKERGVTDKNGQPFPQRYKNDLLSGNANSPGSSGAQPSKEPSPKGIYIEIKACYTHQLAVEIEGQGAFTKTLIQTLEDFGGNLTYKNLLGHLRQYMQTSYKQTPQILVLNNTSDTLLNNGFLKRSIDPRRMICQVVHTHQGWQLNTGAIHGLKSDSEVTLFDHAAPDKLFKAYIRQSGIFLDYALIDAPGLVPGTTYKAEIPGMTSRPFKLELHNHDGNPSEIQRVVNALQGAGVYCTFSDSAEADYTLHFRSGEAYFTFPNDPYRPLTRPAELMDTNYSHLIDTFQQISRWHFIRYCQNEDIFYNLPTQPLKIELTRLLTDGTSQRIEISDDTAKIAYEEIDGERKGKIQIKITNITKQQLYVCAAYLSKEFQCFLDFLPQRVQLLEAGESIALGLEGNDHLTLQLGKVEQEYNWPQTVEALKFIVSTTAFEAEALILPELPAPLITPDRYTRGGWEKGFLTRNMDTLDDAQLLFSGWSIQDLNLVFKNPLYNQVSAETIKALVEWEETSYFATGLYKNIPTEPVLEVLAEPENEPKGLFNGLGIAAANYIETLQRRSRYNKLKKDPSRLRVVALGDSWFQYPFILQDVVEHLYKNYAVYCLAKAGNTMENYLEEKDYLDIIEEEDIQYLLISPSLNNLILVKLPAFLNSTADSEETTPRRYLNHKFFAALDITIERFDEMFNQLLDMYPSLHILVHCYDYFIPTDPFSLENEGKMSICGKHMINKKITPQAERENLMKYIIDSFSDKISNLIDTEKFRNRVTLVDTRGLVTREEWFDEMHPNDEGFRKVADAFIKEIERIRYQETQSFTSNA